MIVYSVCYGCSAELGKGDDFYPLEDVAGALCATCDERYCCSAGCEECGGGQ